MAIFYPVTQQIKTYIDPRDGTPLNGTLRFGNAGQDPQATTVQVYWDAAGTQPAPQPIRVRNGVAIRGRTPANVYANGDFSAIALDSRGRVAYSVPNSTDIQLALAVTGLGTAAAIGITDAGGFYTGTNVEAALQEVGTSLAAASAALLAAVPTGVKWSYCGTVAPTGFVLESGRTIGSVASNATERANADTASLYTLLWNSSTNTELIIQDSAGTPTTRGASAANDFAANKRLPLPDGRGRTDVGKDNMGGSTAGRMTVASFLGTTQFNTGGTETHTLTSAQLAAHSHPMPHTHTIAHDHTITHTHDMTHTHTIVHSNVAGSFPSLALTDGTSGNVNVGSMNVTSTGGSSSANSGASSATDSGGVSTANTSNNTGGGSAHLNVQPSIVYTHIIKL